MKTCEEEEEEAFNFGRRRRRRRAKKKETDQERCKLMSHSWFSRNLVFKKKIKCDVWFKLYFDLRKNCSSDEDVDEVVSSQQRIFAIFPENETNGSD